jgi:hypothetical protein
MPLSDDPHAAKQAREDRSMIRQFDEEGIRFRYPKQWTVEREESDTRWTVTVQSPDTAFFMLTVDAEMPEVRDVVATTLAALKEDYAELEAEEISEDVAGQPAFGHEIRFFSFDYLNTCWTRSFYNPHGTVLVLCQTPDIENNEKILRAICASLEVEAE